MYFNCTCTTVHVQLYMYNCTCTTVHAQLYRIDPVSIHPYVHFFAKLFNKPEDLIKPWDCHILRVLGRLYSLILCG